MRHLLTILIIFILSCGTSMAQSEQDSSNFTPQYRKGVMYTINTSIGTKHSGFVVDETKDYIVLENRNTHEKIEINKSQIVVTSAKKNKTNYSQDILGDNEFASKYMLSGSAFLFEEGTSVSNNHWLFLQDLDYALSENWAVSVHSFLFYPLAFGVKYAYKINDYNHIGFSANAMGNVIITTNLSSMFWGYTIGGKYTHGTSNKNLTISAGLLSLNSNLIDPGASKPYFNIPYLNGAYSKRFNEKFAFIGEAWLFPETLAALGGAGFKYLHSNRIAWTFGCYTNIVSDKNTLKLDLKTLPIPYLSFSRKFN